jgi:hypothetical protein
LILAWAVLLVTLLAARPNQNTVTESLRLLPDLVRQVTRWPKTAPSLEASESG